MFVRKTVNLSHVQLSYLEWKQGKKPLLLLHGLADLSLVWSNLGNYLESDYHIIAPDLRGHGESSKPPTGYLFKDYIADLEELMLALAWQSCDAIAHSWSAKLLAIWATQNPQRFQHLVLIDPFFVEQMPSWVRFTFPLLYRTLPFLKTMQRFNTYQAAEHLAKTLKQYHGWTELQQQVFRASIEQKRDGSWSSKFSRAARDEIFIDVMKQAGLTQSLEIPTLLIKPHKGLNRTPWQLKPYRRYLTHLQMAEVPGNHWAFLVEPETVNPVVKAFLAS